MKCVGLTVSAALTLVTLCGPTAHGQPKPPPPGPITSTYKTLTEVEPRTIVNATNTPGNATSTFIISQPGSYYLDRNLTGQSGRNCISVTADNVTLDLNGFALTGVSGALDGINVSTIRALTIRNGTVRGFPGSGIFAGNAIGTRFENLIISNNTLDGIWPGAEAIVSRVHARENSRDGFNLGGRTGIQISESQAISNRVGFEGTGASTVIYRNCIARTNRSDGFRSVNSQFEGCSALGNTGNGFVSAEKVIYRSCNSDNNGGRGFSLNFDNLVVNCSAVSNAGIGIGEPNVTNMRVIGSVTSLNGGGGIYLGGESSVIDSSAVESTGGSDGIRVGFHSVVQGVTSYGNQGRGIVAGGRTTIQDSTASANTGLGVQFTGANSILRGSIASNNSGGGVAALSPLGGFLLESSTISNNTGVGINIGLGSRIVGNTVRGNTLDGVLVDSGCQVTGNHIDGNGTAVGTQGGIRALNGGNTFSDNYLTGNDFNIVNSAACCTTVVRNISSSPVSGHIQNNGGGFVGTYVTTPASANSVSNIQQ